MGITNPFAPFLDTLDCQKLSIEHQWNSQTGRRFSIAITHDQLLFHMAQIRK